MSRPDLRHRPVPEILDALGLDRADPRCPRCGAAMIVFADRWAGVSLRCAVETCGLGTWAWPSFLLRDPRFRTASVQARAGTARRGPHPTAKPAREAGEAPRRLVRVEGGWGYE